MDQLTIFDIPQAEATATPEPSDFVLNEDETGFENRWFLMKGEKFVALVVPFQDHIFIQPGAYQKILKRKNLEIHHSDYQRWLKNNGFQEKKKK